MAESMATPASGAPASGALHVGAAFRFGWERFKENAGPLVAAALAVFAVNLVFNAVGSGLEGLAATVVGLASYVVSQLIAVGWIFMSLKVHDGKPITVGDLFTRTDLLLPYILASILFGIMFAVGLVLLIVPGIIVALVFGLYGYALVDRNLGVTEALRASADLTRGHRGELFVFGLAVIGLNLLGALALGIGLLVTAPVTVIAAARVFRELEGSPAPA
jgi:uncharacterized membrane protein